MKSPISPLASYRANGRHLVLSLCFFMAIICQRVWRPGELLPGGTTTGGQTRDNVVRVHDPRQGEVERMIQRYFRTWSNQDMVGYGACFCNKAVVQFVNADGNLMTLDRASFLKSQRESHRRARSPQVEIPQAIDINFERQLARVVALWRLTSASHKSYGYNHFTLKKRRGTWQIVNLVFYTTQHAAIHTSEHK